MLLSGEAAIRKPEHVGVGGQHVGEDHDPPDAARQQSTRMVQTQRLKELTGQRTQAESGCADGQTHEHEALRVRMAINVYLLKKQAVST